ncbi:DNA-binding transcriptional regulator, LysR family [Amycolatopsis arida]|uniref:DNA-binding transcriptional regulator, LysR family n=1 Tax=Amycolatopsis arida TaxID=587909 RepID=A0A1I5T8Q7_9PSEU|nr:LysR substrate-binding domain-containing protein [Amycolatopsis arida]TDX96182.1 DNA-binding transcriptional LysR family regulator [Amycolatopsis arida]SFP79429.1 DNA-binding transcriptional regulator, LysR family [Amycolatopsis arida]
MIDLRRLHVLRAVAHYGTVTAAAQSLHLTPSAASQQVRQLGRELGVTLLEPQGRRVRLTSAARALLTHAHAIEERWRQAETELRACDGSPTGVLRMASFPTAIAAVLAPTAARLHAEHPGLTVEMHEGEVSDCVDLLFDGGAELAVLEAVADGPATTDPRFEQHPLLDDPFDLMVAADHPLAGRTSVELVELATERWIVPTPPCASRQHVLAACSAAGFTPAAAHHIGDIRAAAALVEQGLGIAMVPRIAGLQTNRHVARLPITGPAIPARKLVTAVRRGTGTSPAVSTALRALHDQADRLRR